MRKRGRISNLMGYIFTSYDCDFEGNFTVLSLILDNRTRCNIVLFLLIR